MLDVAALQFDGRSISVLFSNNLTINHFLLICFYAYNTLIYTHPPLPPHLTHYFSGDLGAPSLGIP